jgi:hypothetical protein
MDVRKLFSGLLVVTLGFLLSLTILSFTNKEGDDAALARIKGQTLKAPNIEYPKVDIRNRSIPQFDFLVIFPDCTSCSDFRIKAASYMAQRQDKVFLILTPDTVGLTPLLENNRYFVSLISKSSNYSELLPGIYTR